MREVDPVFEGVLLGVAVFDGDLDSVIVEDGDRDCELVAVELGDGDSTGEFVSLDDSLGNPLNEAEGEVEGLFDLLCVGKLRSVCVGFVKLMEAVLVSIELVEVLDADGVCV